MGTDSESEPHHRGRSLSNKEKYSSVSETSDNEDDTTTFSDSDYTSNKSEGDIFSCRAEQFPEEYTIFLKEILVEQLSIADSSFAKIKVAFSFRSMIIVSPFVTTLFFSTLDTSHNNS